MASLLDHPRVERVSWWVAAGTTIFFALVSAWELFGPLPGGHLGNAAGIALAGENMLTWRIFGAVLEYTPKPPSPSQYYLNHPYGVFLLETLAHWVFGHGWVTVRLPAVALSALTPPLLFLLARALWGAAPAAVAALAFALTPIDLAFSCFHNLEVVTIFFGLLFSWATVRLWQSWRPAYVLPATLGALGSCQADWVGLVLVGLVGIFAFARAYVLPRRLYGRVDDRQHARWFAFCTAAAVVTLVMYIALMARSGKLGEVLAQGDLRSSGAGASFKEIFGPRRVMWVTWMLPWPLLAAMAAAIPVWLVRLGGRAEHAIPAAWLLASSFQYFVFRQGADVHIFWPHYFGVVGAFALAALVDAGAWLAGRIGRGRVAAERAGLWATFGAVAAILVLVARVALPLAYQSRLTGGRFDDGGRYIGVDQDRSRFAAWLRPAVPADSVVGFHRSFYRLWFVEYGLRAPARALPQLPGPLSPGDPLRLVILDARFTPAHELRDAASRFALHMVGPFVWFDRASPQAPLQALRYDERQPRGLERYFITGSDLIRSLGPDADPWLTHEWRSHLGQPSEPPAAAPVLLHELRIAHNAAASRGDAAEARRLRTLVEAAFPRRLDLAFSSDLRLIGLHVEEGAATVVSLLWETGPAFVPFDGDFLVRSRVTAPPPVWPSAIDFFEKEVAPPAALRPPLWRAGHLYEQRFVAMRRVGTERFEGHWAAHTIPQPKLADGSAKVELFVLR